MFSGMAWTTIQSIVNILYGFIAVPFLINFYGKEEYGLIGLAMSINAYVTLLDMGMTNSNVRFFSEYIATGDKARVQRLFGLTHLFYLFLGVLNTVILFVASLFVDVFFKVTPEQAITLRNLLWILALNATFSWVSVCFDQFLRAHELIDWIKRRATLLKLLLFAVLACSILLKWPIEWYFFCFTFMGTIILPLTLIKARRVDPDLKFNYRFDKEMFHTIIPYALSIFSFAVFHFITTSTRPLFLGNLIGPGGVAEFSIIMAITTIVSVFTSSVMQVLLPILTKMQVQNETEGVQAIMRTGTKYMTVFLSGLIFAIIISAQELLTVYVGEQFIHLTKWLVLWLLTLLLSCRNVMTALVFTEKKVGSVAIMGAVSMMAALICYGLLTPYWGVGGVVFGYIVHEIIHMLFYYVYFMPRRFNINTWRVFVCSVLPSWMLMGLSAGLVYMVFRWVDDTWLAILVKSFTYGLFFVSIAWFVIFDKNDKKLLKSLIVNKG